MNNKYMDFPKQKHTFCSYDIMVATLKGPFTKYWENEVILLAHYNI